MNLLVIGGLAALLLILLWRAARYTGELPGLSDLSQHPVRLPPPGLLARCFSAEDVAFVAGLRSPGVSRLLFHERRRLALQWLRLTRREAGRVYRFHVRAVRSTVDLRPAVEASLLFHYGLFLIIYRLVTTLVWFSGPFRAQVLGRSVQSLAAVLSRLGGRIAESVGPRPTPGVGAAYGD